MGFLFERNRLVRGKLLIRASQIAQMVKNPHANAGDTGHVGLIPGSGRSPEEGHGNPLQHSCLENLMDRGSLVGYSSCGRKELDMTEVTWHAHTKNHIPLHS